MPEQPDAVLVTGACPKGTEDLAARCWAYWGGDVERWHVDWDQSQGTVVPGRHRAMISAGADVCLGFTAMAGAYGLIAMSRAAGIPTYEWLTR